MVGPSLTDEERDLASRRLKLGFVGLVAASGALTAVWAGGSLPFVAAGFVGGAVLGTVLLWFVLRWWAEFLPSAERARNRGRR
ncbi:hypothetical protein [Halobellus ruber]|uniref:Uncharacterized protein n=1 Tax=Halobellus ruber TaxID=2761102 RepID=A0A7J9SHD0_9EURY|nr:hypothetical protein [Halobellus ruber]